MTLYRNAFQVKIICHVQLHQILLSVSELWPFDCVFMLFCIIHILVHAITNSESRQNDVSGTRMNVPSF